MATRGTSPEPALLRARVEGKVSADAAFEQLYAAYAPTVRAWMVARAGAEADDLVQDVWTILYARWGHWQVLPEMLAPEARPVLSFLFRTSHFVLIGHRRGQAARAGEPLEAVEVPDGARSPERMLQDLQLGQALRVAREACSPQEFAVLMAKLSGVPAREIARTLEITEPMVDHQFRNAIARVQKKLGQGSRRRASRGGERG